jgi:hypothetical protein
MAQTYDSVTCQYNPKDEDEIIQKALDLVRILLHAPSGRPYVVPGEAKIGWNWGPLSPTNPHGLAKYKPSQPDPRTPPSRSILSRIAR